MPCMVWNVPFVLLALCAFFQHFFIVSARVITFLHLCIHSFIHLHFSQRHCSGSCHQSQKMCCTKSSIRTFNMIANILQSIYVLLHWKEQYSKVLQREALDLCQSAFLTFLSCCGVAFLKGPFKNFDWTQELVKCSLGNVLPQEISNRFVIRGDRRN